MLNNNNRKRMATSTQCVRPNIGKITALALAISASHGAFAQGDSDEFTLLQTLDKSAAHTAVADGASVTAKLPTTKTADRLVGNFADSGFQHVMVKFPSANHADLSSTDSAKAFAKQASEQQTSFIADIKSLAPSAKVIGQTRLVANAVYLNVDVSELPKIADRVDIEYIVAVSDYEPLLAETVSYVGGSALQKTGFTGKGVEVAVIDSGIDYTHAAFGGEGTLEAYAFANADPVNGDGVFPTDKVVGGYDFIGEWPDAPLSEDADPLDSGGHGTHVADIIAGEFGMAPDAKLHALKVCRRSCSGVGIMRSLEYAVDPNGDGDPSDALDIINLSLGAAYGLPFDDDASAAVDRASELGVLTVAAAGNDADRPFVIATPSAAKSALSVAWTTQPGSFEDKMRIDNGDGSTTLVDAVLMGYSPVPTKSISSDIAVSYGNGDGKGLNGCDDSNGNNPFAAESLAGKIVMVDRGACTFVEKTENLAEAGAILAIVAQNTPDAPFGGGGSSNATIPTFMISQASGDLLRDNNTTISIAIEDRVALTERMEPASSRGPDSSYINIKPEIGAPGRAVSAEVGTGSVNTPFSGTSGATPVVAGAAAQLLEAYPDWSPERVKSVLISSAERNIRVDETNLAPISRIGGGELRADAALTAPLEIVDVSSHFSSNTSTLPFGFVEVAEKMTLQKTLKIKNITADQTLMMDFVPEFRFEDDAKSGAIKIDVIKQLELGYGAETLVTVSMTIDPAKLPDSTFNTGFGAQNSEALSALEFDGYLVIQYGENQDVSVPWHVVARKASKVAASTETLSEEFSTVVEFTNTGASDSLLSPFNLYSVGDDLPEGERGEDRPVRDLRAIGSRAFKSEALCADSFAWEFAVTSWEPHSLAYLSRFEIFLDVDNDGADDFVVTNPDNSLFTGDNNVDGRSVAAVLNLSDDIYRANYYTLHAANSATSVLRVCGSALNMADFPEQPITMRATVNDRFGTQGSRLPSVKVWPGNERYAFGLRGSQTLKTDESNALVVFDNETGDGAIGALVQTNSPFVLPEGSLGFSGAAQNHEALLLVAPDVTAPLSQDCGAMGVAYHNDNSYTVYLKDQGWPTHTGYKYLCADGACYQGELKDGFYRKTFNGTLGQTVNLEYKIKLANGGEYQASTSDIFSAESCLLP